MGSAREDFFEKSDAYLEHFKACKGKAYESSEYQELFRMADDLIRFVIQQFKAGNLEGKDFFETELDINLLFPITKNEALKKEAYDLKPDIDAAIKEYITEN